MTELERREHERFDSLNLLAYACLDDEGNRVDQGMGRTLNVSMAGLLMETHRQIDFNFILLLDVGFGDNTVDLKGEVVHSGKNASGKFETGIKFIEKEEYSEKILSQYIDAFKKLKKHSS